MTILLKFSAIDSLARAVMSGPLLYRLLRGE
jgi:hypothetical protein